MALEATNALIAIGAISALTFLVYGPWQWVCTDFARQVIFEKRDELFDMAMAGELSFKSREYRAIRSSLESSIRFAHELTWPLLVTIALSRRHLLDERSDMTSAANDIADPKVREKVQRLIRDAQRALILMTWFKSPLSVIALPLMLLFAISVVLVDRCRAYAARFVRELGNLIQVEAEGFPEMKPQKARSSFWQHG